MEELIGQIISIIAFILFAISYQVNKRNVLIIIQTLGTIGNCAAYFFLNATSGFILNIVCVVRNVIYYFLKENGKYNYIVGVLLAIVMSVLGVIFWQDWSSILMIVGLGVNTVFLSFAPPQLLRKSVVGTCSLTLTYNIIWLSIGGILTEGFSIVSSVIGIVRFSKKTNSPAPDAIPEQESVTQTTEN